MSFNFKDQRRLLDSVANYSDSEIEHMITEQGVDSVLDDAFGAMVDRFLPEHAPESPIQLAWRIETSKETKEFTLMIEEGKCQLSKQLGDGADTTLIIGLPIFIRLIAGNLSGLQAYARGQLRVEGDIVLSVRQLSFFGIDTSEAELDLSTPEELARLIEGLSDEEIMATVQYTGIVRVLDKVFQGMIEHYLPEKAIGYGGTIEWNLRSSQETHIYHMTFQGSYCTVKTGPAASAQVRMTADIPIFLRLIAGRLNGLQAYSDGKLQVVGDLVLAQRQQTFFNADLSGAALNISTPSQLSRLIRDRSSEEIEAGVSVTGVDRALDMVFKGMVEHFLPHKAKTKSAIIQWEIHTREGIRRYQFQVNRGACNFIRGTPNKPNVTLSAKLPSFLRIVAGQLDGLRALATGKIKVRGNILLARSHQGWFDLTK